MQSFVFFALAFIATAHASSIYGSLPSLVVSPGIATSTLLKGPSSKATVLGPDGGLIKASAEGAVVYGGGPKVVAAAPVAVVPHYAPVYAEEGPTIVVAGPKAPAGVIIAGPSGTVATGNGVGKTVLAAPAPLVVAAPQYYGYAPAPVVVGGYGYGGAVKYDSGAYNGAYDGYY